jgi:hypothetical protein
MDVLAACPGSTHRFPDLKQIPTAASNFEIDKRINGLAVERPDQFPIDICAVQHRDAGAVLAYEFQIRLDIDFVPRNITFFQHLGGQFAQVTIGAGIHDDFLCSGHGLIPK